MQWREELIDADDVIACQESRGALVALQGVCLGAVVTHVSISIYSILEA